MAVFQNGLLGPHVVHRVGLDFNYVIETAPIPLPLMEGKTARAEISMKGDHVIWKLANQVNQRALVFPLFLIREVCNTSYRGDRDTMLSDRGEVFVKSFEFKDWTFDEKSSYCQLTLRSSLEVREQMCSRNFPRNLRKRWGFSLIWTNNQSSFPIRLWVQKLEWVLATWDFFPGGPK